MTLDCMKTRAKCSGLELQTQNCISALEPFVLLPILILWCTPQTSSVIAMCLQFNSMLLGAKLLYF